MTIQPIGATSVALYITPADLRERGLTPEELTLAQAVELSRAAFERSGISPDGAIEIEAYPDECGVLVFARLTPPCRLLLSFDSFEDLLAAARALPFTAPDAALFWLDGRYLLSLPGEEEALALHLTEFGRLEPDAPHLEAYLAEHGRPILASDALTALLRHFPAL